MFAGLKSPASLCWVGMDGGGEHALFPSGNILADKHSRALILD